MYDWSTFGTAVSQWSASNGNIYRSSGNVGVGTTVPGAALDINGQIKIQGGTPGSGKVLTSDAAGLASWTTSAVVTQATTLANGLLGGRVDQGVFTPNPS